VGRVRRLYVAPGARRLGIARRLVSEILREARSQFTMLRVRTTTREGQFFFEALGFRPTTGVPTATHELRLPFDGPTA
jgi:ribosomal protein S18 acetylase RimI-like enzyme